MAKSFKEPKRVVGLFPDLLGRGGIQEASRQTVAALSKILARHGWSGTFLGLNDPLGEQTLAIPGHEIRLEGFGRAKARFVLRAVSRGRTNGCIVLAAHPNQAVVAYVMKLIYPKVKVLVMSHGVEIWQRLPGYRHRALLSADTVLATSSYNARKLVDLNNVLPDKIRMLPWPLNPNLLRFADSDRELPLPDSFPRGRVILTVGRWAASERYKGADELIRALAELRPAFPDLRLVFVGGGNDLPRLKQIAVDFQLSDAVGFLGNISTEQLAACYTHSELFALPSTGEGFGLVFLEAMAFRKPLVGVAAGGSVDLLEDGVNALVVPPRDSSALTSALERLLRDKALAAELGCRGGEIVRRKYSFGNFERGLEDVLLEVR
jgi:phosphatidylinositol alpha-1,6-mannosyltransferase